MSHSLSAESIQLAPTFSWETDGYRLPLFDGTFTDRDGVRGRLGPIDSHAEIGLIDTPPNTAAAGPSGGHYVSVIGSNALFHNPEDRGSKTVDVDVITRFTKAFATVTETLSAG